jgi:hypothetical protein
MTHQSKTTAQLGTVCNFFTIIFFAAPLATMVTTLALHVHNKDTSFNLDRHYAWPAQREVYKTTVYVEIFARRKFSPVSPPSLIGENFITLIFCPVLKIWQPFFTALAKKFFLFCNTKVRLGEIFIQRKFHVYCILSLSLSLSLTHTQVEVVRSKSTETMSFPLTVMSC